MAQAATSPAKLAASLTKPAESPAKPAVMMGPPPEQPAGAAAAGAAGGDKAPAGEHRLNAAKLHREGCWPVKEQPQTMAYALKLADAAWAQVFLTQGRDGTKASDYMADVQITVRRTSVVGCGAIFRRPADTTVEALVTTNVPNIVVAPGIAHAHVHESSSRLRLHCGPHCAVAMPPTPAAAAMADSSAQEPVVAPAAGAMFIVATLPERTTLLVKAAPPSYQRDSVASVMDDVTSVYLLGHTQVHPAGNCELVRHATVVDVAAAGDKGGKGKRTQK